jgi:hypothetical protein
VIEKYGEYTYRMYEIFLGWSVEIAREGGSTAYQIVCYKNDDNFDRGRFIGKTALGESSGVKNTDSVSSVKTTEELVG